MMKPTVIPSREDGEESPAGGGTRASRRGIPRFARNDIWLCVALLLAAGCAAAPPAATAPPMRVPSWTAVPSSISETLCANFRQEGISSGTTMNVVRTTQPLLITPLAMAALANEAQYHGRLSPARAADEATAITRELPVSLPQSCSWRAIEPQTGAQYADVYTIELSPPIANPFGRGTGMFARLTLGGEAPTWYWLQLVPNGDAWTAGRIKALGVQQ